MRVLWICNIMLPMVAKQLGREMNVKEGWVTGLARQVLTHAEETGIELAVCFPAGKELAGWKETFMTEIDGKKCRLSAYAFLENTVKPERYSKHLELELSHIFEVFKPNLIHCFGTEYPHTLAAVKVCPDKKKILLGIQGICFALAEAYYADLPKGVCQRFLLRDLLRWDNIMLQKRKFYRRGKMEKKSAETGTKCDRTYKMGQADGAGNQSGAYVSFYE